MNIVSAYLLESDELPTIEVNARLEGVLLSISNWLTRKGVADPAAASGEFDSLTEDGNGTFTREEHVVAAGSLHEVKLEEFSRSGQIFTTRLAVAALRGRLHVYCSLSVSNSASVVAPIRTDPRCPAIVRALLGQYPDWKLNGTPLPVSRPRTLIGESGGQELADEIRQPKRTLPVVVVSEIEGEQLWPKLAEELAFDLAGLAQVFRIDDEASWLLSEVVGKRHSCYWGAVRLYWPPRERAEDSVGFNSTVWTASMLMSHDKDGRGFVRFRSTLRRLLMSTAAISITPPVAIREIQAAVAQRRIDELQARAAPDSEELAIARLYITENQQLKSQIEDLQLQLARVGARADAAEHALSQLKAPDIDDDSDDVVDGPTPPVSGDVRYYKKNHSKPAYDVFVEVQDCGHSAWQSASKADKARKGLERLTERSDWKSMLHCGTCTGGGMWKVRW